MEEGLKDGIMSNVDKAKFDLSTEDGLYHDFFSVNIYVENGKKLTNIRLLGSRNGVTEYACDQGKFKYVDLSWLSYKQQVEEYFWHK